LRIDYLDSVLTGQKTRAYVRDVVVRAVTKTSLVKLIDKKKQIYTPPEVDFDVTSRLQGFNDVVVMAHYDVGGVLSESDVYLLESFKDQGFEVVLATTSVQGVEQHQRLWNQVSSIVECLITRPNQGFDFGSWAAAINYLDLSQKVNGRLILINNSVFGPFQPMSQILESWSPNCDVFGITSSNEFRSHVQSYFLGFQPTVLKSESFKNYWKNDFHEENKWLTIFRFEMLWAEYFKSNDFQICVRHKAPRKFLRNPLTFLWLDLLQEGMPFLKKSIFKQNYDRIDISQWRKDIESVNSDFPLDLIEKYINSTSA
jgi:lipopolysaccharide biosynthesis protein